MIIKRFLLVALLLAAALFSAASGLSYSPIAEASQDKTDTTATGFPTGTVCKTSGTYRASNKYLANIIVMGEGETFPPFSDGTKTIWYPRNPAIKTQ